jgi:CheY-like chemotaxis protein
MSGKEKSNTIAIRTLPTVLVIESNPTVVTQLSQLLRGWGALTVPVNKGNTVGPLLEKQHFDLILLSLQMPDVGAPELTARLRQGGVNSTTPIIAMASATRNKEIRRVLEAGANDTLALPTSVRALARICWYWLKLDQYPKAPVKKRTVKREA